MLARVKWGSGKWRDNGTQIMDHGTLLTVVHSGHEIIAIIAVDKDGRIVKKQIDFVTVTTRFDWDGPPKDTAAVTK